MTAGAMLTGCGRLGHLPSLHGRLGRGRHISNHWRCCVGNVGAHRSPRDVQCRCLQACSSDASTLRASTYNTEVLCESEPELRKQWAVITESSGMQKLCVMSAMCNGHVAMTAP